MEAVVGERTRRVALRAAPFVGGAIVFVVVLLVVANLPSSSRSKVKTSRTAPGATTSTSEDDVAAAASSTTTTDASGHGPGPSPVASSPRPGGTATTTPAQTTTTVSPWAGCVPAGTTAPQPRDRCWQTFNGPQGNSTGSSPSARGCVVHNTGTYSQSHDDLHCTYDAINPGGYSSDGTFNMIRIVRDGRTITIDGTAAPNCATNLIQPGDAVYVDGRNDFDSNGYPTSPGSSGSTTTKVGDDFKCPDAPPS